MSKVFSTTHLTPHLSLSECHDGFWLYDHTRGMNLSIRAKSPEEAFVECISYYQKRLSEVENKHDVLVAKINSFLDQFAEPDESY